MVVGSRFVFNEGKAGRQTVDDADGRREGSLLSEVSVIPSPFRKQA